MTDRAKGFNYNPRPQFLPYHNRKQRYAVLICHRRAGKALDIQTPIPLADGGWKAMGDLQQGDMILGADGLPTPVTWAHPIEYDRPCMKLTFSDGSEIVADAEHL